jgi:small-conductance mechanosensitive channel
MSDLLAFLSSLRPAIPAVVLIVVAWLAGRVTRRLLAGQRDERAERNGFRIQIVLLGIWVVSAVLLLLVLPLDPTLRGQLLSLFGIVLSAAIALSSTTFVGNAMAGIMLKAVRNFRTGDFVRVGEHFGRVTIRGLLSTEIQTEDRDLVTLPNLHLVTQPVKVVRASGTLLTAEVSLGYDVRHDRIEKLLEQAAEDVGLRDPFVLVTQLGDFSVTYRVVGLLQEVKQLLTARSLLHGAMLDRLHGDGVEIVSPGFMNQRALDPARPVIPRAAPGAKTEPEPADEPRLEDVAFDKADEAETLEQLEAAHARTREAIAALADAPPGSNAETAKQRQEVLTRRLAQLEQAMAARREDAEKKT